METIKDKLRLLIIKRDNLMKWVMKYDKKIKKLEKELWDNL